MQKLTGLDAGFLYMETPTLHMHTLKVAVIDPSTVPGGYTFEKVREVLGARLHLLEPFRRRLAWVPLGLDHPVWIEDPDFHLDNHLRRLQVLPPGGPRQLAQLVSDIAERPLDRTRPLWEISVVEGLADGRVGFVAKIHHAVADGVAAAAMLLNVLGTDPASDAAITPPAAPWCPDPLPTRRDLLAEAGRSWARGVGGLPELVRRTAGGLKAARRHRLGAEVSPPLPFATPTTSFNRALTASRWFATTSLPLADVRRVKDAFGTTVNDVVLAVVAGSLRSYLAGRGELPAKPLVAGVPVSTRDTTTAGDTPAGGGNQVSNMFTSLCTDVADPVDRLRAISKVTREAKGVHKALGSEMLADWSEITPPRLFAGWMRLYSRLRLADRHRPPINLVVSNVPGPREPLYIAGARLDAIWSMGPILEGIGLNITVWSYLDRMYAGLVACRETMPDLWDVAEGMESALAELVKRAG